MLAVAACRAPRELQSGQEPTTTAPPEQAGPWRVFHGSVQEGVHNAAAWIDSFLSDERSLAEENRSWVAVRGNVFLDELADDELDGRIGGRLVLPKFQNRLHLAFGGKSEEEPSTEGVGLDDPPPTDGNEQEEDVEAILGLQYMLRRTSRNHLRADLGASFEGLDVDPYLGVRWRHTLPLADWQGRLTERLRAYADAGLDSRTTLDFERLLGATRFFRATSYLRWREEEPGVEYGERLRLFLRIEEARILSFEWDNKFVTEPANMLDELALRVRDSHLWDNGHILFEIAPQIAWREEEDYEPSLGLILILEFSFGRERKP